LRSKTPKAIKAWLAKQNAEGDKSKYGRVLFRSLAFVLSPPACEAKNKARRFCYAALAFFASYLVFRLRLNIRLNMPCRHAFVFLLRALLPSVCNSAIKQARQAGEA
jgi:hypothetical protein